MEDAPQTVYNSEIELTNRREIYSQNFMSKRIRPRTL